jgi:hypothetical protein
MSDAGEAGRASAALLSGERLAAARARLQAQFDAIDSDDSDDSDDELLGAIVEPDPSVLPALAASAAGASSEPKSKSAAPSPPSVGVFLSLLLLGAALIALILALSVQLARHYPEPPRVASQAHKYVGVAPACSRPECTHDWQLFDDPTDGPSTTTAAPTTTATTTSTPLVTRTLPTTPPAGTLISPWETLMAWGSWDQGWYYNVYPTISATPVYVNGTLVPQPSALRCFDLSAQWSNWNAVILDDSPPICIVIGLSNPDFDYKVFVRPYASMHACLVSYPFSPACAHSLHLSVLAQLG